MTGPLFSCELQSMADGEGRLYGRIGDELAGAVDFVLQDGHVAVVMVYVRPAFRSRGVARRMMRELEARMGRVEVRTPGSCGNPFSPPRPDDIS
ncbi:GNAT family N-acetyltransferase [Herbaspirillum sp. HC18]|nr:GNAT family N-acetyltransferase [Herbaspirillum sp. HC18]